MLHRAVEAQERAGVAVRHSASCATHKTQKGEWTMILRAMGFVALFVLVACSGCDRSPEALRNKYLARGQHMVKQRDYARAILEFKNAAGAMPRDPEAYYQLGLVYVESRDLQSAVNNFLRAVELNPKHRAAQLQLSRIMASAADPEVVKDAESRLMQLQIGRGHG